MRRTIFLPAGIAPASLSVRDYLRHKRSAAVRKNETPNPTAAGLGVADFVANPR